MRALSMLTPHPVKPSEPMANFAGTIEFLADGILSRDRVPAKSFGSPEGKTITALMRDPESVPAAGATGKRVAPMGRGDRKAALVRTRSVAPVGWPEPADGKTVWRQSLGTKCNLRDAASGKIMRKWATDQPLSPLAFSPDGKMLAAGITQWGPYGGNGGKESGGVQFWDIERASLVRSIADDKPVTFIRYSVDGKCLATSSNAGPLKLWNVATGELTRIFPALGQADFSPDGKTIACQVATASHEQDRRQSRSL